MLIFILGLIQRHSYGQLYIIVLLYPYVAGSRGRGRLRLLSQRTAEVLWGEVRVARSGRGGSRRGRLCCTGSGIEFLIADIADSVGHVDAKLRQSGTFSRALSTHTLTTVATVMLEVAKKEIKDCVTLDRAHPEVTFEPVELLTTGVAFVQELKVWWLLHESSRGNLNK